MKDAALHVSDRFSPHQMHLETFVCSGLSLDPASFPPLALKVCSGRSRVTPIICWGSESTRVLSMLWSRLCLTLYERPESQFARDFGDSVLDCLLLRQTRIEGIFETA
jgi:hypothetical protein